MDYIDSQWEQFVLAIQTMDIDPWLDTNCATWNEQYFAYEWAYYIGHEAN